MAKRARNTSGCLLLLLLPIVFVLGKCTAPRPSQAPTADAASAGRSGTAAPDGGQPARDLRYVDSKTLNQRASPNGTVVGRIEFGAPVEIHQRRSGWARISPDGEPERWVFEKLLCEGEGCSSTRAATVAARPAPRYTAHRAARRVVDGDGSCPCASSSNCFGPRGGRYCITSGGNKRYR